MTSDLWVSITALLPADCPGGLGVALLLVDLFIPKDRKGISAALAALGLIAAGVCWSVSLVRLISVLMGC